jgi:hypothetical protein
MLLGRGRLHAINTGSMQLHETHKLHVLAALLLIAATAAGISRDAEGATTPTIVGAAKALVFGIVPCTCSTGSLINVATAPPFASKYIYILNWISYYPWTRFILIRSMCTDYGSHHIPVI